MRFIDYPAFVLVSSCKLVPVMIVGALVNKRKYLGWDYLSAAIMTGGVLLYSMPGASGGGSSHGHGHGHDSSSSSASTGQGSLLYTAIGISLVLCNLTMEGFTNAGQDRIYGSAKVVKQVLSSNVPFYILLH
jgi:hypothetical protein